MKFGMPSLIEYTSVDEHIDFCRKNNLDFLEINLTFPWYQSDRLDIGHLVRLKEETGIGYTLHFHDQLNPFDFSPELRRGAMDNILFGLDLARRIGADRITMHLIRGAYSAVNEVKVYAYSVGKAEYLDHVREFMDVCEVKLDGTDTIYCIENTNGYMDYQKDAVDLMLQNPHFGLTFDIGHNFKTSFDDEAYIMSHADKLRHFHIHDVSEKSNHIALGSGIINLPKYLDMLRQFACSAVIEVKESQALHRSLSYLRDHGFEV